MQHSEKKVHLNARVQENQSKMKSSADARFSILIEECRKGRRPAQRAIYEALSSKMFAVCIRYMGDRQSAEDVLQDGFVTLFSKIGTYSGEGSFEGWARKIFVNTALMSLRKADILKKAEDTDAAYDLGSNEVSALQSLEYQELLKLISELPPGFRTVFNMYVIENYSHKEIAEALGISEGTSRSQLQRARMMLQSKIRNYR